MTYRIQAPSGTVVAEEFSTTSAEKTIETAESGVYDFCFDNKHSMFMEKVVYFDLGIYDDQQEIYRDPKLAVDNSTSSEMYTEIVVSW